MRISDWSADVCSSDLTIRRRAALVDDVHAAEALVEVDAGIEVADVQGEMGEGRLHARDMALWSRNFTTRRFRISCFGRFNMRAAGAAAAVACPRRRWTARPRRRFGHARETARKSTRLNSRH